MGGDTLCRRWVVEPKTCGVGRDIGVVLLLLGLGLLDAGLQVFVEASDTLMQVGTIVRERCRRTWVLEEVEEILEN